MVSKVLTGDAGERQSLRGDGPMKLSLFIGGEHRPGDALPHPLAEHAEQVRLARQLGFDGVSIGNHLSCGATGWFPPFETLMRLSAEADGMSLGTCMLILPLYHPFHVAEQVALLDAASGGRAILGVAPGWRMPNIYQQTIIVGGTPASQPSCPALCRASTP
jgi:alkanesulfonate monooxygenase SsuD/methylene tetrahydromethanopterin reductase-like flavin-dependent oxidoreductase (luciferase family)